MLAERKRLLRQALALADAVTLAASFGAGYEIVGVGFDRRFASFGRYTWLLWLIIPIWLGALGIFGLYRSSAYSSRGRLLGRLAQAHTLAALLLLSLMYLTHSEAISRLLLQVFLAVSFVLLSAQKVALAAYLDQARRRIHLGRRKVILVSHPAIAERYMQLIQTRLSILADVIRVLALQLRQRECCRPRCGGLAARQHRRAARTAPCAGGRRGGRGRSAGIAGTRTTEPLVYSAGDHTPNLAGTAALSGGILDCFIFR
jgi:FlaA1/EpsC-like NDP-sugar epimerase